MKNNSIKFKRIAIKVGSNVISCKDGSLNVGRMLRLVEDIAVLCKQGNEVILISSGAVAAGRGEIIPSKKTNEIAAKQIWAAVGQVKLMSNYQFLFGKYGIQAGQMLATKESFRDRRHYLNMKNCITAMLENKVLPVVNENDTASVNELMFTDNDELSGLISSMMDCRTLIVLTNVDGIFNAVPGCPGAELIREVGPETGDLSQFILSSKSGLGRGGMLTKYSNARRIAAEGIDVYIANGNRDSIISDIVRGKDVPYSHFMASTGRSNGVKKWLTHSDTFARGAVWINEGARAALTGDKATSLLMIGITRVEGYFRKGDIVRILDQEGNPVGLGKSQYDSKKAEQSIGEKRGKPLILYDYMVINENIKETALV
ncbi:MAG: glutamate 5-kinase [Bacteroidales bacterium]|nr:glutamate 5-kinase [Bacteroidales bacterium]